MPILNEQMLIETAKRLHGQLNEAFYEHGLLTKEEFDQEHGQVWENLEAELIAGGWREPRVDYQVLYDNAVNIQERLNVIARVLRLEE